MNKIFSEIFSEERINRLRFFKYQLGILLVGLLFVVIFPGGNKIKAVLLTLCFSAILSTRRLHDLNKSGWFALIIFVPLVNIIFELYLLFAPGTVGDNQYGADPLAE